MDLFNISESGTVGNTESLHNFQLDAYLKFWQEDSSLFVLILAKH